jgi:hypothetical protein
MPARPPLARSPQSGWLDWLPLLATALLFGDPTPLLASYAFPEVDGFRCTGVQRRIRPRSYGGVGPCHYHGPFLGSQGPQQSGEALVGKVGAQRRCLCITVVGNKVVQ